jgi:hypothetical protein
LGASSIFDQGVAVQTTLGFMLREVTGNVWVEKAIDTYCNAQRYVLQQAFDKFLRLVYRRGLGEIINGCDKVGMSGKFGQTELRTFITGGRVIFTFARRIEEGNESGNECSVSFVGEADDLLCLSAGLQSVYCDLRTALDIIEDVIKNWPQDTKTRNLIYIADKKVLFG